MTWRMAKSLETLREQLNTLAPHRDKSSDGGIGNPEHSARTSDHNPAEDGVVKARDFTHDPAHGVDSQKLADMLAASRDDRIKYLISNRKIMSGDAGPSPWMWRPYTGKNPHDHHFHISVKADKAHYDDTKPWAISLSTAALSTAKPAAAALPTLRKGDRGTQVMRLQDRLNHHGALLIRDGDFGKVTESAVKIFQNKHDLVDDGIVGVYSWRKLND